jgi:hypothetical protein
VDEYRRAAEGVGTVKKLTNELVVGDIIVADGEPPMTERVTAIEPPKSGVVYKIHVDRQVGADAPDATFFYSGRDGEHEVVET